MVSRLIVTCGVLAGLFAAIGFLTSLILALSILNRTIATVFGSILLFCAVGFVYLSFWRNEDGKLRWQYIFTMILSLASGIILISLDCDFYVLDAKLNKFSIFVIVTIAITSLLSVLLPYITNKIIADSLKSANIFKDQETTLYIIINLLTAFLVAAAFTITDLEANSKVFSSDFTISIAVWAIAAILGAIIGYLIESKSTPLASQYDSNYDTAGTYDNIK